jgi:type I restriction enzyme S subunit
MNQLLNKAASSAQPKLNKQNVRECLIPLPPTLTEQKAIATALSDVDELISELEKLIEKKKAIKQGAMQALLTPPHKGGKRLEGFSGEWVEVELSNILTFGSGLDYKHLDKGEIPVYGTGGVMTYVNDFLFNGESVGIGRKGTIDRPILLKGKFWTVDTLFYTHSFQNCIPKFIYYLFLLIQWKEYNEASGVPSLNKNTLGKIKVTIPTMIAEQEAISQFLSTIENSINKLIGRKSKLQSIKQGMMQELLTGKTRLA